MNIALIFAGGSGNRMGTVLPKQFLKINGVPILVHTMRLFERHPEIDLIYLAVPELYISKAQELIEEYDLDKTRKVIAGGDSAQDTIYRLLKAAEEATRLRYECLEQGRDFVFETVFSSAEKVEFLHKAKETGFFIRLFYVCTSDPAINVSRIVQRYINGGHEVPISKIISRYYKSLVNAAEAISFVDGKSHVDQDLCINMFPSK